jgi:hypothetical protein
MIPLEQMPGAGRWSGSIPALLAHPGPLWVHGGMGTGVSTVAAWLAQRRGCAVLDDAERMPVEDLEDWLRRNPNGVLGAHLAPEALPVAAIACRCLALGLRPLEEDPDTVPGCLAHLAAAEGHAGPLPPALGALPCPGSLAGLRNRLLRWTLLGQLGETGPTIDALPLPNENLAANLHVLERLLLHRALRRSYGNRVEAAGRLGISRRQLYLLIARHGDPVRGEAPSDPGPKRLAKASKSISSPLESGS